MDNKKTKNKKMADIVLIDSGERNALNLKQTIIKNFEEKERGPAVKTSDMIAEKIEDKKEDKIEQLKEEKIVDFTNQIFTKNEEKQPLLLQEKKSFGFKKYIIYFFIVLLLGATFYAGLYILPRAEINVFTKKTPWNFSGIITASKNAGDVILADKQIPAEIFKDIKNLTLSFPAHGKKYVERKAAGEIEIYNIYSSQPQSLVAGTRIESPDGKIFRLDKKITVPGAKIAEGKIAASSIKTTVAAEKAGEEYNIAPTKFTVPGFKGTAKYDGFYAVSSEEMKGGLVGDVLFPTEEDLSVARRETSTQLEKAMNDFLLSQINKDFKVFEWNRLFNIIKESVDKEADKDGNFLISLEGELRIIAFKEFDVLKLMSETAKQIIGQSFEIKTHNLNYETGQYDVNNGKTALNVDFKGEFWQPINIEAFKNYVLNKKENELKVFVFSLPGVERATFSLWPIWVRKVPDSSDKIKVEVN